MRKVTKVDKSKINNTTGKRIAFHRRDKGYSQQELADKLFIKRELLSMYENDTRTPTAETLIGLADALDLTTDYLLCRISVESKAPENIEIHDKYGLTDEAMFQLRRDRRACKHAEQDFRETGEYDQEYFRILKLRLLNFLIVEDKLLYSIAKYIHTTKSDTIDLCVMNCADYTLEQLRDPNFKPPKKFSYFSTEDYENLHLVAILKELERLKKGLVKNEDNEKLLTLLDMHEDASNKEDDDGDNS